MGRIRLKGVEVKIESHGPLELMRKASDPILNSLSVTVEFSGNIVQ